jgi:hypothetical protein
MIIDQEHITNNSDRTEQKNYKKNINLFLLIKSFFINFYRYLCVLLSFALDILKFAKSESPFNSLR